MTEETAAVFARANTACHNLRCTALVLYVVTRADKPNGQTVSACGRHLTMAIEAVRLLSEPVATSVVVHVRIPF